MAPEMQADEDKFARLSTLTFLSVFCGLIALFYSAVVLIDPYDAGYFPSILGPGVFDPNEHTNIASRARDQRFDAAIFGNSRGQLLNPGALTKETGLSFIQLFARGTGPRDQLAIMRYFLRRHPQARAIVVAADQLWCTHDRNLPSGFGPEVPVFPRWLYSDDRIEYLSHMLNTSMFRFMRRRVEVARGAQPPTDLAGYINYEVGREWTFNPGQAPVYSDEGTPAFADFNGAFPAISLLERSVRELAPSATLIAAMPPIYSTNELAQCKARLTM